MNNVQENPNVDRAVIDLFATTNKICYKCVHDDMKSCTYESLDALLEHKKIHYPETYLMATCPLCGDVFGTEPILYEHIRDRHSDSSLMAKIKRTQRRFKCSYCLEELRSPDMMKRHANRRHTRNVWLQCPPCGMIFDHIYVYEEHLHKTHAITLSYKCARSENEEDSCHFGSNDLFDMHEHVERAHNEKSNQFTETYVTTLTQGPEAVYSCMECMATYRSLEDKIEHCRDQHDICTVITCNDCEYHSMNDIEAAVQHGMDAHEMEMTAYETKFEIWSLKVPRPRQCKRCLKQFVRPEDLANHLLEEHDDLLAYACRFCDVGAYSDSESLLIHVIERHVDDLGHQDVRQRGIYEALVCHTKLQDHCVVPWCLEMPRDEDDSFYHYRDAHPGHTSNMFMCEWCSMQGRGRMFYSQVALGNHVRDCYAGRGVSRRVYDRYRVPNLRCCLLTVVETEIPAIAAAMDGMDSPDSGVCLTSNESAS